MQTRPESGSRAVSFTNIGVLTPEATATGGVHLTSNRGTWYFRGTDHVAFGGHIHDAPKFMKSQVSREVFAESDLTVVVAAPGKDVAKLIGFADGAELMFDVTKVPEVKLFRTKVNFMDFSHYLDGLKK